MKKKLAALSMALLMVLGIFAPTVQAAPEDATQTVTLHKLLMSKEDLAGWDAIEGLKQYDGKQTLEELSRLAGKQLKEIAGVFFAFTDPQTGQYVKKDGTTTTDLEDPDVLKGLTLETGIQFDTSKLKGSYKIVEIPEKSTYSQDGSQLAGSKAVPVEITLPMYNKDGLVANAHVYPKNTEEKPEIDKNFQANTPGMVVGKETGAAYENYQVEKDTINRTIGSVIPYDVKTKIPADSRYQKLVWGDEMQVGLTYQRGSLEIKTTPDVGLAPEDYLLLETDHGFTLTMKPSGLDKINAKTKQHEDVQVQLTYSAKLNNEAVVDQPYKNSITLDYSNKPHTNFEPKSGQPQNRQISVTKTWSVDGKEEAPSNVKVIYTLQKEVLGNWVDVEKAEVGNGGSFDHIFKDLDDKAVYRVIESISGYDPEYVSFENGQVVIRNKKDSSNPNPLKPTTPSVETYGKKFVKTNEDGSKRLFGAKFVIRDAERDGKYLTLKDGAQVSAETTAYEEAERAYLAKIAEYNQLSAEEQKTQKDQYLQQIQELKTKRDAAYQKARMNYAWTTERSKALELTSNNEGQFEITGLAAGTYYLEEVEAPKDFAKLTALIPFTVGKGTYSSHPAEQGGIPYQLEQAETDAQKITNKKISIPQTGGIGTVLFTVGGLALMGGAGFALVKGRRREAE